MALVVRKSWPPRVHFKIGFNLLENGLAFNLNYTWTLFYWIYFNPESRIHLGTRQIENCSPVPVFGFLEWTVPKILRPPDKIIRPSVLIWAGTPVCLTLHHFKYKYNEINIPLLVRPSAFSGFSALSRKQMENE